MVGTLSAPNPPRYGRATGVDGGGARGGRGGRAGDLKGMAHGDHRRHTAPR